MQAASVTSVLWPQMRHEFLAVPLLGRLARPSGITLISFFLAGFEKNSAAATEPVLCSLPVGRGTKRRESFWHTLIPSLSLQPAYFWPLSPTVALKLYILCSLGTTKHIFYRQKLSFGIEHQGGRSLIFSSSLPL